MSHHKKVLQETLFSWLPLAVAIIIMSSLVYVVAQQSYRNAANDPQIQIAQDITTALNKGDVQADAIVPPTSTSEMSSSLATFVTIFSATGTPVGSSVAVDGKLPTIAEKILVAAKKSGESRITWQPKPGLRIATVITSYKNSTASGFVLAGRSLKETDIRIAQLGIITAITTLIALILSFLALWQMARKNPGLTEHHEHTAEHHHTHSA
ncbi:MAG: hypothetical protein WC794_04540 [Candidatus Doudnabacteria bacterium]|jgi:undecaprenyl pyrophosphate phosphatase UppP